MKLHNIFPLFLIVLLSGCSAGAAHQGIESPSVETTEQEEVIQPASQLDSQASEKVNSLFSMTPVAHQAQQKVVAECLAEKGFNEEGDSQQRDFRVRDLFPLQVLTVEDAHQYGYSKPSSLETDGKQMSEGALQAYIGNPENGSVRVEGIPGAIAKDGCLAHSYEEVFGDIESGMFFSGGIVNLPLPYIGESTNYPKYKEVVQSWSRCMLDNYQIDIETPDLLSITEGNQASTYAVYDATCREKIGYESVVEEALDAYMTTFLEDKAGLIDQLTRARQEAEENAPKVLGS